MKVKSPELPTMLTMRDVQEITRLSRDMVYRLPHQEGFPAVRFGRAIRVPRDLFFVWLEKNSERRKSHG